MAIINSNLPILSTPITTDYYTQWAGSVSDVRTLLATTGTNLLQGYSSTGEHEIFNNGLLQIKIEVDMAYNQYRLQTLTFTNLQTNRGTVISNPNYRNSLYLCLGYDDSLQTAYFFMVGQFDYNGAWTQKDYGTFTTNRQDIYEAISGSQIPTYIWQSVPAISGKNGILSLTQILNINDGEPVENVTNRGNLDFSKKTKVNTLVNSVYEPTYEEDATKATVSYDIPEAEYQYTKLVYKKKKIPKSASDGTAIDIGADDTEVVVSGLEENSTYYFVVFTNRTKSNAYKFKTGHNAPEEGILKLKVTIDKALLDNDIKDFVSYEKLT